MAAIHAMAVVESGALLGAGVEVAPFAVVESGAVLGDGCRISAHAVVKAHATIGANTSVGEHAVIGGDPQDLNFDRTLPNRAIVGCENVLREGVTIHRGTVGDSRVGDRNYLMCGVHLGHDVVLGDDCVLANNVLLAGHVYFGDRIVVGGAAVFHQFVRVGSLVMVQGMGRVGQDILPFTTEVEFNTVSGLNRVGLKRAGFDLETRQALRACFDLFYRSGLSPRLFLEQMENPPPGPVAEMVAFVRAGSKRGYCQIVAGTRKLTDEEN